MSGPSSCCPKTVSKRGIYGSAVLQDRNLVVHCQEVTPVSLKEGDQHSVQEDTSMVEGEGVMVINLHAQLDGESPVTTSGLSGPSRNGPCMYGIGKSQEPFGALRGQPTLLSTGKVGEAPTSPSCLLNQGGKDVGTVLMLPQNREQEGYIWFSCTTG